MRALATVLVLASPLLLFACNAADDDDDVADVSAALETGDTGSLAQSLAASAGVPEEIAEHVARHALGALYPADCATRWIDRSHTHLQFVSCTGPFGKRKLSGGIDFDIRVENAVAYADIKSAGDLETNGRPFSYQGTASWKLGSRDVHWTAHASGTTGRGRAFDKSSTLDIAVDTAGQCSTLRGSVSGTVNGRGVDVQITDYRVCGAACPASGEIVKTREAKKGTKVRRITFDGSAKAQVVTPQGVLRVIPLACGEDAE